MTNEKYKKILYMRFKGKMKFNKIAKKRQNSEDKAELIQFNSKGNTFFVKNN